MIKFELENEKCINIDGNIHDKLEETIILKIKKSLGGKLPTYNKVIRGSNYIYPQFDTINNCVNWCIGHTKSG